MKEINFSYENSSINIGYEEKMTGLMNKLIKLFCSHFAINQTWKKKNVLFDIYIYDINKMDIEWKTARFLKNYILRTSSMKKFNLQADLFNCNGMECYRINEGNTYFLFSTTNKQISIYATNESEIAIIEFIRDLVIRNEENYGAIICHAAAVVYKNMAILITGAKAAGKTTLLYDLILNKHLKFLSGDKVFLYLKNEKWYVRGWPDYPHVGVGTIKKFTKIKKMTENLYEIEKMTDFEKILLNPEEINHVLGGNSYRKYKLETVVFPDICSCENEFCELNVNEGKEMLVANFEFKNDYPQYKWHELVLVEPDSKYLRINNFEKTIKHQKINYHILKGKGYIGEII